jgi:hypothetical protein
VWCTWNGAGNSAVLVRDAHGNATEVVGRVLSLRSFSLMVQMAFPIRSIFFGRGQLRRIAMNGCVSQENPPDARGGDKPA